VRVAYASEADAPTLTSYGAALGVAKVSPTVHAGFTEMMNAIAPAIYQKACAAAGKKATWEQLKINVVEADQLYELGCLTSPWANQFTKGTKRGEPMF
jgi:hypothetical protein